MSPSICYIFFAVDDVIVSSVNTYTSMMGIITVTLKTSTWSNLCEKIRNMEQSDCLKCFLTKTGVMVDLKHWSKNWQHRYCWTYWVVVDLALSTQYLCPVLSIFLSALSVHIAGTVGRYYVACFDVNCTAWNSAWSTRQLLW